MLIRPDPPTVTAIYRPQLAHRPITLVGIADPVNPHSHVVNQLYRFTTVAQPSIPAAYDIIDAGILGRKSIHVRRYNKVISGAKRYIRKKKVHTIVESPAGQVDRFTPPVKQLDVLGADVLGPRVGMVGVVHNLVDEHLDGISFVGPSRSRTAKDLPVIAAVRQTSGGAVFGLWAKCNTIDEGNAIRFK